jgi:agmatine deiminase
VPNVTLHDIPTNDAWVRDYGPMFLVNPGNGQLGCVNWRFNAWGGKYPPWDLDDAAGNRISSRLAAQQFQPALVLEGGAVDGNGQGTIMTTESCLLDPRRNRHATPADLESSLRQFACAQHILWLPGGPLAGDDTDGHVDQLARFAGARRVLVAVEEDPADENHVPLQANRQQLEAWRDGSGAQLEVIGLPLPQPIRYQGQRVPASYCNFYLVNGGVVMPEFDDPADARARAILAQVFPDRQVVGIAARDLIWGRGAVHCLTLQQPG